MFDMSCVPVSNSDQVRPWCMTSWPCSHSTGSSWGECFGATIHILDIDIQSFTDLNSVPTKKKKIWRHVNVIVPEVPNGKTSATFPTKTTTNHRFSTVTERITFRRNGSFWQWSSLVGNQWPELQWPVLLWVGRYSHNLKVFARSLSL